MVCIVVVCVKVHFPLNEENEMLNLTATLSTVSTRCSLYLIIIY